MARRRRLRRVGNERRSGRMIVKDLPRSLR